ncbi:LytR C-terminal domain-containing protein [Actinopolymorpha alba]|uniref:LytR C-terminal domain-containing protein n=1 Tax=Actinopolymorpha alba TaxID=533267 RepID=UPI0003629103|nr:LytR C-terminal domain-containing protein [Actinopolymorpha alba]
MATWDEDTGERYLRRRRRRIRGPLTLLVLVGIVSGAAWYGWDSVLNVAPAPGPTQVCSTPGPNAKQRITAQTVAINVYNAGRVAGLADRTAAELRQRGFTVRKVGNAPKGAKVAVVEIRGRAKNAPEVILLARQFSGEKIEADGRSDVSVDLIIGADFHGLVDKAPSAMDVDTPVPICVTATPTPVRG